MFGFGLSKMTKASILIGVTGVALIGLGYAVNSVTGLIDEMTEDKSRKLQQPVEIEMQELPPEESENSDEGEEDFRSTSEEEESSIEDCIKFAPYDKESIVEILSDYMIVRSSFAEWKNATKIGFIKEIQ